jgi:membrane-bound lytic murein transglycosylase B
VGVGEDSPREQVRAPLPGQRPPSEPKSDPAESTETKVEIDLGSDWDPAKRPPPPGADRPGRGSAIRSAVAAFAEWSRRPIGRVALPAALLFALVGMTTVAGAVVLPANAPPAAVQRPKSDWPPRTPATPRPTGAAPTDVAPGGPVGGLPTVAPTSPAQDPANPPQPAARPADVLTGWAQQMSAKTGINVTALKAYGYAQLVVDQTTPACQLSWTTLAAIGKIESGHGTANSSTLTESGQTVPHIIGLPLDGKGNRGTIRDTDDGLVDGDSTWDRAVGPMQFIPSTWNSAGIDADNDGAKDPNDIDDAALAAANYLCRDGRNLTVSADWWGAIASYNDVQRYINDVFAAANDYGTRSRT